MKRKILVMMHYIADKFMTYHAIQLGRWTTLNQWVCNKI